MPKGLLLLLLLLLVGGYFFLGGGGTAVEQMPGISSTASLSSSESGYVLSVEGKISLPESKKYELNDVYIVLKSGESVIDKKTFSGGGMDGPAEYPVSGVFNVPSTLSSASVLIHARIKYEGKETTLESVAPVVLPPKESLIAPPGISITLKSVALLGNEKKATLQVRVSNQNDFDIELKNFTVKVNEKEVSTNIPSEIPANSEVSGDFVVYTDKNEVTVEVSGTVKWGSASKDFSYSFPVSLPTLEPEPLSVSFETEPISITGDGYKFSISGKVENPNAFSVTIDYLKLKVYKSGGNLLQEFDLLKDKNVDAEKNAEFSETVTVDEDMAEATGELLIKYGGRERKLASFPIFALDFLDLVEKPGMEVNMSTDGTTHSISFLFKNNDPNVTLSVNDVKIVVRNETLSSDVFSQEYDSAEVEPGKEKEFSGSFSATSIGSGNKVKVTITGQYGIEALGTWVPFEIVILRTSWG